MRSSAPIAAFAAILARRHMHRYRSHNCGELRDAHIGEKTRLSGWCHRIRDHGGVLFVDLRDHYGMTQCVVDPELPRLRAGREAAFGVGGALRRRSAQAPGRNRERRDADWRHRNLCARDRGAGPGRRAAAARLRRSALSGRDAAQIPLSRSAPREASRQHHAAWESDRRVARSHEGARLFRVPDADSNRLFARRRARLPCALAHSPRQVLRAAAGAAAI